MGSRGHRSPTTNRCSSDSGSFTGHDSAASLWASDDGFTWSWMGYDEAVFGSEDNTWTLLTYDGPVYTESRQFMSNVITTDFGVVAVGADWSRPAHSGCELRISRSSLTVMVVDCCHPEPSAQINREEAL
jgi:hypothetical protein